MSSESTNTLTLDSLRESVESKYRHFELDLGNGKKYTARNPLRLPKEKREYMAKLSDRLKDEGADSFDVFADALAEVAERKADHAALMKLIDGDLALLASVFESYMDSTQAGEASPSEN